MSRFAVLIALAGCRQLLGLSEPSPAPAIDAPRTPDAAIDAPAAVCPPSYSVVIGTSRYRFNDSDRVLWPDAEAACARDSANQPGVAHTHLAVIDSSNELTMLVAHRQSAPDYWIGITQRRIVGAWVAVTDQPIPPPMWGINMPRTDQGADCAMIMGTGWGPGNDGLIGNDYCTAISTASDPFICECDGNAEDPSRF